MVDRELGTVENLKESQQIRLWVDMVIIPALLFSIAYKGKVGKFDKVVLVSLAVATVVYNANNYMKFNKK